MERVFKSNNSYKYDNSDLMRIGVHYQWVVSFLNWQYCDYIEGHVTILVLIQDLGPHKQGEYCLRHSTFG